MKQNEKHGCLTAWIILMIIANSVTSLVYIFGDTSILENPPFSISKQWILIIGVLGLANIYFAVNLWKLHKWSFWAFGICSLVIFCINVFLGLGLLKSLLGTLGIVFLYGILQIKNDSNRSGWDCLK
jgi:hypothetical protein